MTISCTDSCGATVAARHDREQDIDAALAAVWTCLQITGRWRCPACVRVLRHAAAFEGVSGPVAIDRLPRDSIGALKRETASSILPVAVRG